MEFYLEVCLAAGLNIETRIWLDNNPDLDFTNGFAYAYLVYLIGYPLWLVLFYFWY